MTPRCKETQFTKRGAVDYGQKSIWRQSCLKRFYKRAQTSVLCLTVEDSQARFNPHTNTKQSNWDVTLFHKCIDPNFEYHHMIGVRACADSSMDNLHRNTPTTRAPRSITGKTTRPAAYNPGFNGSITLNISQHCIESSKQHCFSHDCTVQFNLMRLTRAILKPEVRDEACTEHAHMVAMSLLFIVYFNLLRPLIYSVQIMLNLVIQIITQQEVVC